MKTETGGADAEQFAAAFNWQLVKRKCPGMCWICVDKNARHLSAYYADNSITRRVRNAFQNEQDQQGSRAHFCWRKSTSQNTEFQGEGYGGCGVIDVVWTYLHNVHNERLLQQGVGVKNFGGGSLHATCNVRLDREWMMVHDDGIFFFFFSFCNDSFPM